MPLKENVCFCSWGGRQERHSSGGGEGKKTLGQLLQCPLTISLIFQWLLSPLLGASLPDLLQEMSTRYTEPLIEPVVCFQHIQRKLQDSQ
ncbi:hypothetical protein E2320_019295 [Naja naja]|nr:hypothetical protein E2320_019295 [Naja naja]